MKGLIVCIVAWTLLTSKDARAGVVWSMNGASCRPDPASSIFHDYYYDLAGAIKTRPYSIASFYCPVIIPSGVAPVQLELIAKKSIFSAAASTRAQLVRVEIRTGLLSNVGNVATDQTSGATQVSHTCGAIQSPLDFTQFFYYVRVDFDVEYPDDGVETFYAVDLNTDTCGE